MLCKEEFIKTIDVIKEYYEKEEKLTKYLHEFLMNGYSVVNFGNELISKIIELLAKSMSEKHWEEIINNIEHFMYDYNFGDKPSVVSVKKDTTIKTYYLISSSVLYDYIMDYLED